MEEGGGMHTLVRAMSYLCRRDMCFLEEVAAEGGGRE